MTLDKPGLEVGVDVRKGCRGEMCKDVRIEDLNRFHS